MDCPCPQQLPVWIEYIKAFSTPFAAVVAAGIGGWIAYQQWNTAAQKLRFDLFEKRYAVYQTVRTSIVDAKSDKEVDLEPLLVAIGEAPWFFDNDFRNYLKQNVLALIKERRNLLGQQETLTKRVHDIKADDESAQKSHDADFERVEKDLFKNSSALRSHLDRLPTVFHKFMKIEDRKQR